MDSKHLFHSRGTYLLMRLEYIALLALCAALVGANWKEVDWFRFILAFATIDLIGYLPGTIVSRRYNGCAPAIFHHLYNVTHSFLTWLVLIPFWALLIGGLEWAMLAVPIHLSGDRGLFGNVFKPIAVPFSQGASQEPGNIPPQARERGLCPRKP